MVGFTLLEVMIAMAIMAGVILTTLGAVNSHITLASAERDSTALTLIARSKLNELLLSPQKAEGVFADNPDTLWKSEIYPAEFTGLQKFVVTVKRKNGGKEVALVCYLPK